jgi:hypothetical protein
MDNIFTFAHIQRLAKERLKLLEKYDNPEAEAERGFCKKLMEMPSLQEDRFAASALRHIPAQKIVEMLTWIATATWMWNTAETIIETITDHPEQLTYDIEHQRILVNGKPVPLRMRFAWMQMLEDPSVKSDIKDLVKERLKLLNEVKTPRPRRKHRGTNEKPLPSKG